MPASSMLYQFNQSKISETVNPTKDPLIDPIRAMIMATGTSLSRKRLRQQRQREHCLYLLSKQCPPEEY